MIPYLKNIATLLFTEKTWTDNYGHAAPNQVAAGDPSHGVYATLPAKENIDTAETDNSRTFIVDGSSMKPEGIESGDKLRCKPVSFKEAAELKRGERVIIKVDSEYYKAKGRAVKYDYKLRKIICMIKPGTSYESLLSLLESSEEDSILLKENKKLLKEKFDETYNFYSTDREMMLSVTYKNGVLRYSFHPVDLIKYVVTSVEKDNL